HSGGDIRAAFSTRLLWIIRIRFCTLRLLLQASPSASKSPQLSQKARLLRLRAWLSPLKEYRLLPQQYSDNSLRPHALHIHRVASPQSPYPCDFLSSHEFPYCHRHHILFHLDTLLEAPTYGLPIE